MGSRIARGGGEANIMQDRAVDLQHETGVDGNLHPCVQSCHLSKGFCAEILTNPHLSNCGILYLIFLSSAG